jgi:hypothetical protein
MANWPEKTDTCVGTATKYGAPDVRRFARLYNNQNVNNACHSCSTVCINESNVIEFQSDSCGNTALYIQEPNAGCHNIRIKTTALAANSVATIPALATTDTFTFNCASATLTNKTVDLNSSNIIKHTGAAKGDQLIYNLTCTKYESKPVRETFKIDFGNETTVISTGNGQKEFQMPYDFTITEVFATVATASSSGLVTIQIQQNALDILSTELTIDASEKTSRTAATPVVIADNTMDNNGIITFDLDGVGTGVTGLVLYVIGYQRF